MQQDLDSLQGTIGAVVYQNYENGYAVLRLQCEDGQAVTVVGTIPRPAVGAAIKAMANNLRQSFWSA